MREVAILALKLGSTAFGGPAAHIALLRHEVVDRRQWLSDHHFLDLLGTANLIPGPTSTELMMHVGFDRARWRGLAVAGLLFILPAAAMTLFFAWLYVRFGATPAAVGVLYGVKPVVIAVVIQAIWALSRTVLRDRLLAVIGVVACGLALAGGNELGVLLGAGVVVMLVRNAPRALRAAGFFPGISGDTWWLPQFLVDGLLLHPEPYSPVRLFFNFLKIGATLYGSGYVLIAFLEHDFVDSLGWLTRQQLLDAVAIGQLTPGPLFTTATFVGYLVGGWAGAAIATVAIFLPSFLLVGITHPLVPRLRRSPWAAAFLDGVNVAAIALMIMIAWTLGRAAIVDGATLLLGVAATILLMMGRFNAGWLIVGGGALGLLLHTFMH